MIDLKQLPAGLGYTAEDFGCFCADEKLRGPNNGHLAHCKNEEVAAHANALLLQRLRGMSTQVFGGLETSNARRKWDTRKTPSDTHHGILIVTGELKNG